MQRQKTMFKQKDHKALTLGDAVPAIVALVIIAITGAVGLLILTNFQSNSITTPGVNGGGGGYGIFLETTNFINLGGGTISTNSPNAGVGQASGGAGVIVVSANTFSTVAGSLLQYSAGSGDAQGGAGSNTFNVILTSAIPIPFATGGGACSNNMQSTVTAGCTGNIIYTSSVTLTGDVNATGTINVLYGAIVTTNGWDLVAGNAIINNGLIISGNDGGGGGAGTQTTNGAVGQGGQLTANSFGGSGGGGDGCFTTGGRGGNTIKLGAAGGAAGATCTAGSTGVAGQALAAGLLTNANVILYAGGGQANILIYLSGGGAGGSSPQYSPTYNGLGNGVTGLNAVLSFQSLLGLVIIAAIIIGIVVGAFAFGKGGGTREEF